MPRSTVALDRETEFGRASSSWRGLILATSFAVGLHALVILGIRFTVFPKFPEQPVFSLNVNLVEEASGEAAGGAIPALANQAPPNLAQDIMSAREPVAATADAAVSGAGELLVGKQTVVTTRVSKTPINFTAEQSSPAPPLQLEAVPRQAQQRPSTAAAGTGLRVAHLTSEAEDAASKRREKIIDSSDASTLEGYYAESWRLKVEQIGTLNFPAEARRRKVVGRLTLDVAIRADGSVHSIKMLESSGHPLLDRAARRIVYLASPFEPFPETLRQRYDLLHIVRTWEFDQGNRLRSSD